MRKITCWEANDGLIHRHRTDAASRERSIRNAQAGVSYMFLLTAYDDDELRAGRLPPGTEEDGTEFLYFHESKAGVPFEKAIDRILKRCKSLRDRTGLEWFVDHGVNKMVGGKQVDSIYLHDNRVVEESGFLA